MFAIPETSSLAGALYQNVLILLQSVVPPGHVNFMDMWLYSCVRPGLGVRAACDVFQTVALRTARRAWARWTTKSAYQLWIARYRAALLAYPQFARRGGAKIEIAQHNRPAPESLIIDEARTGMRWRPVSYSASTILRPLSAKPNRMHYISRIDEPFFMHGWAHTEPLNRSVAKRTRT